MIEISLRIVVADIHCGIEFSLNIACTATVPPLSKRSPDTKENSTEQGYIWDSAKKLEFVNNINMQQVNRLYEEIENNNFDVNNIVETINNIWQSSAKSSFRKRKRNCPAHVNSNNNNNSNNNFNVKHKWFNEECKQSRINYRDNKDAFRRNKSYVNKTNLIRSSKAYKNSIKKAKLKARREFEHELRLLKSTNPRKYWTMLNINKSKCHNIPVPMQNMFDHFKSLNITPDVDDDIALSSCAANNPDLN